MADPLTLLTLAAAGLASVFMAWAIGAGSSGSTPFAPAVGANAVSIMQAAFFVGLLGILGALFQGANVTEAVGRELVQGVTLTPAAATVALLTAAGLVALGVFAGYPIATAFTVTGAVIGAGLALGGEPAWSKYRQIGALWVGTPPLAGGIAYATARLLRAEAIAEERVVPVLAALVGGLLANVRFALLGPAPAGASFATAAAVRSPAPWLLDASLVTLVFALAAGGVVAWWMRQDARVGQQRFLLALGGLVAFSAGGSQVGLAIGPLLPLVEPFELPLIALLVAGGVGLLVGSWTGAPRMIKALARDYSALGPRRGIAALIPAFVLAQAAVLFGIPISFNEVIVSAIVGSGFAAGIRSVSSRKMGYTVLAWVASFAVAVAVAYTVVALAAWVV